MTRSDSLRLQFDLSGLNLIHVEIDFEIRRRDLQATFGSGITQGSVCKNHPDSSLTFCWQRPIFGTDCRNRDGLPSRWNGIVSQKLRRVLQTLKFSINVGINFLFRNLELVVGGIRQKDMEREIATLAV